MLFITRLSLIIVCVLVLQWIDSQPAESQNFNNALTNNIESQPDQDDAASNVLPVYYPASSKTVPLPVMGQAAPVIAPVPKPSSATMRIPNMQAIPETAPELLPDTRHQRNRPELQVSRMSGEVHFKHLQGKRIDPSRALSVKTGKASWCELKVHNCTGRIWADSQLAVFPDSGVLYLEKGALIVHVNSRLESGIRFTVIAGDYLCRVHGTTLRVNRTDRMVDFQVLEGTITVYNRQTGEVFRASQVSRPQSN